KRNSGSDPELALDRRRAAEELDHVGGLRARGAEANPAALSQGELLALELDLVLAVDGDVGAVRAHVGNHEFVLAPLDGAMLARGVLVVHHEAAVLVAPDDQDFLLAP